MLNLGHGTSVVQLCIGVRKAFLGKAFLAGNMPAHRLNRGLWLAVCGLRSRKALGADTTQGCLSHTRTCLFAVIGYP